MWRTYVMCLLLGLLLASASGNILLMRQVVAVQSDVDRLSARTAAAENARANLQRQIDELRASVPTSAGATPGVPAAAVPTLGVSGFERALLRQVQDDVAGLRGLMPKREVPVRFLDEAGLRRYFLDTFNRDYLPIERETDQKLLTVLGLLGENENVAQIMLGVLQEQVIGIYNENEKVMYVLGGRGEFGPDEKNTIAHEYTHALQDQYFDLTTLSPKHPTNDDRALAIQALVEGDAVLMQRLWSQQKLSQDEIARLGQGASESRLSLAPLFLRGQLLFPYNEGFNFVRQIYQTRGGYVGVDEVFRDPPDSTTQILHIEKYRSRAKPTEVSLPDVSLSLGEGWRKISSNVFGELDLRLVLEQLTDRTRAVRGSNGWNGDRWQLLEKDGRQALVLKSVWDSENDARNFFDTFGLALSNRFGAATREETSSTRQALTASTAATELRRSGQTVVAVISFDRPSAEAIVTAL